MEDKEPGGAQDTRLPMAPGASPRVQPGATTAGSQSFGAPGTAQDDVTQEVCWPASLAPSVPVACMPALTDNWCVRGIVAHAQLVQTGQRGGNEGGFGEAEAL